MKGTHSINTLQLNVGAGVELVDADVHQQQRHLHGTLPSLGPVYALRSAPADALDIMDNSDVFMLHACWELGGVPRRQGSRVGRC